MINYNGFEITTVSDGSFIVRKDGDENYFAGPIAALYAFLDELMEWMNEPVVVEDPNDREYYGKYADDDNL